MADDDDDRASKNFFQTRGNAIKDGIGTVMLWAGPTGEFPEGWLLCDGQELDPRDKTYFKLFTVIGSTYGAGADGKKFQLPDMKKRAAVGADPSSARYKLGAKIGQERQKQPVQLNLPNSRHYTTWSPNLENPYEANHAQSGAVSTEIEIDTVGPSTVMNYIIRFK